MHENTSQIQLNCETYVYICSVNSRWPPQGKSPIGNLIKPWSLCICQLLILHGLFKTRGFLPKETFPTLEIGGFEKSMLKNSLYSPKSFDYVVSIMIEIPELSIMPLVCPPKRVLFHDLVRLEFLSESPVFVEGECKSVFLKKRVDTWYSEVPGIFQIVYV